MVLRNFEQEQLVFRLTVQNSIVVSCHQRRHGRVRHDETTFHDDVASWKERVLLIDIGKPHPVFLGDKISRNQ